MQPRPLRKRRLLLRQYGKGYCCIGRLFDSAMAGFDLGQFQFPISGPLHTGAACHLIAYYRGEKKHY